MKALGSTSVRDALVRSQEGSYVSLKYISRSQKTKSPNGSDTLNRHILVHSNAPERSKRIPIACQTCRGRKTKCDAGEPCLACCNLGIPCVRVASSSQNTVYDLAKKVLLHPNCEGSMVQAMRCGRSDKPSPMPVSYALGQQGIIADIKLPGDMDGGMVFGTAPLHRCFLSSC